MAQADRPVASPSRPATSSKRRLEASATGTTAGPNPWCGGRTTCTSAPARQSLCTSLFAVWEYRHRDRSAWSLPICGFPILPRIPICRAHLTARTFPSRPRSGAGHRSATPGQRVFQSPLDLDNPGPGAPVPPRIREEAAVRDCISRPRAAHRARWHGGTLCLRREQHRHVGPNEAAAAAHPAQHRWHHLHAGSADAREPFWATFHSTLTIPASARPYPINGKLFVLCGSDIRPRLADRLR